MKFSFVKCEIILLVQALESTASLQTLHRPPGGLPTMCNAAHANWTFSQDLVQGTSHWAVNEPSLLANKTSTSAGTGQGWRIWLLAAWLILVALTTVGVSVANLIVART